MSKSENIALLERHQVPFVVLERPLVDAIKPYSFVGHDNFQSGYLATKSLLEAGHRKIAFLGWDSPIPNVLDRVEGYRAALNEYQIPLTQQVLLDELSQQAGYRMAQQLRLAEISAVVLGHHESAKGVLQYFQKKGVNWPESLSVVLIGTPEWAGLLNPSLTCVKRPEWEMGTAAAEALLEKLRNPAAVMEQQVFACSLLPGESIRRIK
jgi:LacI family transcriptional regulator